MPNHIQEHLSTSSYDSCVEYLVYNVFMLLILFLSLEMLHLTNCAQLTDALNRDQGRADLGGAEPAHAPPLNCIPIHNHLV